MVHPECKSNHLKHDLADLQFLCVDIHRQNVKESYFSNLNNLN